VPSGRLTLNWVGKDQALLTTPDGGYEWVDRTDPRVTEIRLLHERETVGAVGPDEHPTADNLLIHGDAADGLRSLLNLPEFAAEYRGKVKLVYIDPPFNTNQAFLHYDDALEHSVWLTMMRDRLTLIRDLLAPDGSVWVHLDDAEMAYCRVLMDEIFGRTNFVASVVWQKADSTRNDAKGFSVDHDSILIYRAGPGWDPNRLPRSAASDARFSAPDGDPRAWFDDNPSAPGAKTHQGMVYAIQHPLTGKLHYPARGRCWWTEQSQLLAVMCQYAPYELRDLDDSGTRADLCGSTAEAVRRGVKGIVLAVPLEDAQNQAQVRYDQGNWPMVVLRSAGRGGLGRKSYVPSQGLVPSTWWSNDLVGHNRQAKAEIKALFPGMSAFDTPKPERLLQRIIHIGSQPGDIVLDCFAGSGTTAAVAQKMSRRWVTVEKEWKTFDSFTRPRLAMVTAGEDPGGITEAVGWQGGGGFRVLEVGPSMYDVDDGRVLLAKWTSNGQFAAAACAQLGFTVDDDPPFAGRRGRVRLAAVDGVADSSVVRALVSNLDEKERLVIVAKAAEPGAESLLRELSSGSRLLKAPRDLVGVAQRARR